MVLFHTTHSIRDAALQESPLCSSIDAWQSILYYCFPPDWAMGAMALPPPHDTAVGDSAHTIIPPARGGGEIVPRRSGPGAGRRGKTFLLPPRNAHLGCGRGERRALSFPVAGARCQSYIQEIFRGIPLASLVPLCAGERGDAGILRAGILCFMERYSAVALPWSGEEGLAM